MNARHCNCGHNVLAHFARTQLVNGGVLTVPDRNLVHSLSEYKFEPFKCHGPDCHCRVFTEDRSLWHQFRRWVRRAV